MGCYNRINHDIHKASNQSFQYSRTYTHQKTYFEQYNFTLICKQIYSSDIKCTLLSIAWNIMPTYTRTNLRLMTLQFSQ